MYTIAVKKSRGENSNQQLFYTSIFLNVITAGNIPPVISVTKLQKLKHIFRKKHWKGIPGHVSRFAKFQIN